MTYVSDDSHGYIFKELGPSDLCYIDAETIRILELLENNVDASNKKHSLLGYLNEYTCTTSGTRLIKEGIIKPFFHQTTLEHRLDCVEHLVGRIDVLGNIANCIKPFGLNVDLEAVVPALINLMKSHSDSIVVAEKRLDALTTLQTLVSQISSLVIALEGANQSMLNIYKIALEDLAYNQILDCISSVIEPDVRSGRGKRGKMFKIKQGVDSLFDIARSSYYAAISDLEQYVRELYKMDGISWKLSYGETRGYFLTISTQKMAKDTLLPPKYIRIVKTRNTITCTTQEMMQSNVRASISYENSMKLSNDILKSTLASIMDNMDAIYKMVDIVGILDLITGFAKLVVQSNGSLVRPRFTPTDTIVSKSRHPILELALSQNNISIVPNDVVLSVGHKNVILVTGPNMGGKSIFLKQVAIIQILAQIGCYVPAESAHLKLVKRIVARSGTSDDIESTCSSFMCEMKGIASALQQDRSDPAQSVLYIIDEVGRGTSIDDGASYSFAIAEELALRRDSFTIFATHFDQVFALTTLYRNIVAYHFKYEEGTREDNQPRMKINHSLVPGLVDRNHYGIKLAEACGLPKEILDIAKRGLLYHNDSHYWT